MNIERRANSGNYKNGGRKTPSKPRHAETGTVKHVKLNRTPEEVKRVMAKARENNTPASPEFIYNH